MCIKTTEALYIIKDILNNDIDECCEAIMDKDKVIIKLVKLEKYIEKINGGENPVDLNHPLDGYY